MAAQLASDPGIPIVDVRTATAEKVEVSDQPPEYEPIKGAIWVKPDQAVERMNGALVIPGGKAEQRTGLVLSSGSECCKPGDKIVWLRVSGIEIEGQMRFVVHEDAVFGVKRCPQKA